MRDRLHRNSQLPQSASEKTLCNPKSPSKTRNRETLFPSPIYRFSSPPFVLCVGRGAEKRRGTLCKKREADRRHRRAGHPTGLFSALPHPRTRCKMDSGYHSAQTELGEVRVCLCVCADVASSHSIHEPGSKCQPR